MTNKNIIKKFAALLVLSMTAFCMAGCIRYRTDLTVKKNGKTDIEIVYAIYDSADSASDDDKDEMIEELEELGWKVKKYTKDSYTGLTISMNDVKLDDLEELLTADELEDLGFEDFSLEKKGSTYVLDWETDFSDKLEDEGIKLKDLSKYNGFLEFNLELPNKSVDNNATEVSKDGKSLSWDLTEEDEVHVEFKTSNSLTTILMILAIAAGIIIIAAIAVVIIILGKKKSDDPESVIANAEASFNMPENLSAPSEGSADDNKND